jgi:hypothetical protein
MVSAGSGRTRIPTRPESRRATSAASRPSCHLPSWTLRLIRPFPVRHAIFTPRASGVRPHASPAAVVAGRLPLIRRRAGRAALRPPKVVDAGEVWRAIVHRRSHQPRRIVHIGELRPSHGPAKPSLHHFPPFFGHLKRFKRAKSDAKMRKGPKPMRRCGPETPRRGSRPAWVAHRRRHSLRTQLTAGRRRWRLR